VVEPAGCGKHPYVATIGVGVGVVHDGTRRHIVRRARSIDAMQKPDAGRFMPFCK
jgi:hypothetical protein